MKIFDPSFARTLAESASVTTPEALRDKMDVAREVGCDEFFLVPTTADPAELDPDGVASPGATAHRGTGTGPRRSPSTRATPSIARRGVPFDHLATVRRQAPVCPSPHGAWYLSRFALVEEALRDVGTYRSDLGVLSGLGGVEDVPPEEQFLSEITGERHRQIRRLFNATFGPHRSPEFEPSVRAICRRSVDDMLEADVVDLHGDYALQIPGLVMTEIMGLPDEAPERFMEWSMDGSIMKRPCSPDVGAGQHPLQNLFTDELPRPAQPRRDAGGRVPHAGRGQHRGRAADRAGGGDAAALHGAGRRPHHAGALTHLVHRLLFDPDAVRPPGAPTDRCCPTTSRSRCGWMRRCR